MARDDEGQSEHSLPGQGWFCHHGGHERGPLDLDALREALRLLPRAEVLVWHPSLPEWVGPNDARLDGLFAPPPTRLADPIGLSALLFSFKGRIGRAKYFWTYCLAVSPYMISVISALIYLQVPIDSETGVLLRLALAPPFIWISLALTAKRLHDFNTSATHLFWIAPAIMAGSLVPPGALDSVLYILSGSVELWLLLKPGASGPNRYGRGPLAASMTTMNVHSGKRKVGWNVWTGVLMVGIIASLLVATHSIPIGRNTRLGGLSCSDPSVMSTVKAAILDDPRETFNIMMYGGKNNIRMSLTDIRTQDYDNPINGFTCVALFTSGPINSDAATNKETGALDVVYDVQRTDANDGRFVVHILSHGIQ